MNIYAYDKNMNLAGVIDAYESFIWTERALGYGDFELVIPYQHADLEILVPGNYFGKQDTDVIMIIETVRIQSSDDTGVSVTVTGKSLESLLNRRIITHKIDLGENKSVTNAIYSIMTNECSDMISSTSKRRMPIRIIQNPLLPEVYNKYEMVFEWDNVYDIIYDLCDTYGLMFAVRWNKEIGSFIFTLAMGVDRSYSQELVPHVIFSPKFENLSGSDYLVDKSKDKNAAIVESKYNSDTKYISDKSEFSGLDRKELYVDGTNISSEDSSYDTGYMPYSKFVDRVDNLGQTELAEYKTLDAFEGTIKSDSGPFIYGIDYFAGDIVQIVDEFGMMGRAKVSEVIQSSDTSKETTSVTFEKIEE